jgi:hypothetical protein
MATGVEVGEGVGVVNVPVGVIVGVGVSAAAEASGANVKKIARRIASHFFIVNPIHRKMNE